MPDTTCPRRGERAALAAFAAAALLLRVVCFFRYRFDSDEPQHLHVAWGWTAGLVQYRDLFDNHAPLFHMLSAPLLAALGERPDILLYMRAPMVLLFALVIWATWTLARRLYDIRVACWSVLLLTVSSSFFLKSLEYRTDNLWNTLCLLALVLVSGFRPLSTTRMFVTGLLLGAALSVSLKTPLVLLTMAVAALITSVFTSRFSLRAALRLALPLLIGLSILPAILIWYFHHLGAWDQLVYCVFRFNATLSDISTSLWMRHALYPLMVAALLWFAYARRFRARDEQRQTRYFFAIVAWFYLVTLLGLWVLISPRDMLPIMPIMAIFLAAAIIERARRPVLTLGSAAFILLSLTFWYARPWKDQTLEHITMMRQVLTLSRPGEPLMDLKGETIYRRRPFYYIFELITRREMAKGLIADTIPEDMIRTNCHVAQADGEFLPPRGRAFLVENFLDMGRLRASGQWLRDDGSFTIAIPGSYVILGHDGQATGTLDGSPYLGPRMLAAGRHRFERASGDQRLAVLWAPAFQRGYSPFHLRDREF